ncbi:KDGP aldolase [Schnuerera sp. xch1]|uniref:2-dehydro-3-deoxy-phosphogluconate aldolase n=1 Tax=Schnuerera sp. xch1 TaxID=2874283 RepID=UPI001CBDFF7D|nr:KDGP aldolase [Schnuerera sp. xch1]MBZ2175998.1 KDGP aldolase [Schnuerera sp. xch1]
MELDKLRFYKDRVAINLLAKNIDNAKDILEVLDGNGVIGILSKKFNNIDEGVKYVKEFQKYIPTISIGLGAGDPNQWKKAAVIAAETDPGHVNQVFATAGYTVGLLKGKGCKNTLVNALISPTGTVGMAKISTGSFSAQKEAAIVDIDTALCMLKDFGINSLKFFNIRGAKHLDELREAAKACVRIGIPVIEPTGGITTENIYDVVKVCIDAGCQKVIPHVYSSAIDKETGLTDINVVKQLYVNIKKII